MKNTEFIDLSHLSVFEAINKIITLSINGHRKLRCKVANSCVESIMHELPIKHHQIEFI